MKDFILEQLDWKKGDGLIPAIVQDAATFKVLMLGYMNKEALQVTLETHLVTFYSRSKKRLWTKGETTSHFLKLVNIIADCDNDTLLVLADPLGNVCHLNTETCFGDGLKTTWEFLEKLEVIIDDRYRNHDETSYTSRLFQEGIKRIAQKVGEEGLEVALASVTETKPIIIGECADLIYHLFVLLRKSEITFAEVITELEQRHLKS